MQKQTPRTVNLPRYGGDLVYWARELVTKISELIRFIRNDLDNGATTFPLKEIAGIANVDKTEFDDGQIRLYQDTSDSDKIYLVARVNGNLKKVQLT